MGTIGVFNHITLDGFYAAGLLRYVNAGHNPPFVTIDGHLQELSSTGKPIGILPESMYHEEALEIPPGATLFLYTDGLNEAANAA